jgi:hypothetical protein
MKIRDCRVISRCCKVCKSWNTIGKRESVWRKLCADLWADKVYVPQIYKEMSDSGYSRTALQESLSDSKRTFIFADEFTSSYFHFRFKMASGSFWTDQDPYWQGKDPIKLNFDQRGPITGFPGIRWFFVNTQGDICEQGGNFVCVEKRIFLRNISTPTYTVCRHENWGFIIQAKAQMHWSYS